MKLTLQCKILSFSIIYFSFILPAMASSLMQKGSSVKNSLFSQTKPQCIGRYVIDVPVSFNNIIHDMIFIDDFKIVSKVIYFPAFKQRVHLRQQELLDAINKPGNSPGNGPFLKEVINLPENKGVIFDHNETGTPDIYRQLEAHVYVNGTSFIIKTDIRDFSGVKNQEKKIKYMARGFSEADTNTKPAKLAAMQSLIARLSGRKDEDIPQEKGVCIPNGFIRDDGYKHIERVTFSYENEDFTLGLNSDNKYPGSEDTLFNRSAEINEALKKSSLHTIKKESLTPNGIPSEMWFFGGKQIIRNSLTQKDEEIIFYDSDFYANERDATSEIPKFYMGITSEYKKTRYSEDEMLEIWNRLINSLRYK